VTKKSKNGRKAVLSSKAKKRQERSMDMAEAVMDRKEKNIEKSKDRARLVQERSKAWEEQNKKILAKKAREEALALALEKDNWVDVDDEVTMDDVGADIKETAPTGAVAVVAAEIPLPETMDAEDEVL
jgi:hypothetical protein